MVVIGGGTGTHTVLKGLKKFKNLLDISAIVTMADSGVQLAACGTSLVIYRSGTCAWP